MNILFYQNKPNLRSTMLNWTLAEELRLLGANVYFLDDFPEGHKFEEGQIDWVRGGGETSPAAVMFAERIGAKCHLHLEGVAYFRIGADSALNWGFTEEPTQEVIDKYKEDYRHWMKWALFSNSCSINGQQQIDTIRDHIMGGKTFPNTHKLSCGVDARFAMSYPKQKPHDFMITVSRIAPNKMVWKIAEALQYVNPCPQWVIIGFGDPEYVEDFMGWCKKKEIKVVIKPAFGAEKWYHISRARVMLLGWTGIPPSEGIMCNIPVISYDHPDIIELYGDTLYWAENNNPKDYALVIKTLLSHPGDMENDLMLKREKLLRGDLYATTQELLAKYYMSRIFI